MSDWADIEADLAGLTTHGDPVTGARPGPRLDMQLKCRTCLRLLPREAFYRRSCAKRSRELDCKVCWLERRAAE